MRNLGEECIYGNFECPQGASCFPNGSGNDGTCRCESFFGFQGSNCDELSAASWLLFALTSASIILVVNTIWVNVVLLRQLRRVGLLQQDSVGRTVLFGFLMPCPLLGLDIGIMVTLFGVDESRLYDHYLRVPLVVTTQFLFVAATLSVSTVWLEMANKAKAGRAAVAPQPAPGRSRSRSRSCSCSQGEDSSNLKRAIMKELSRLRKCAVGLVRRGRPKGRNSNRGSSHSGGYDPYRATLYGTAWGTSLAMLVFLIALADPLSGSFVLSVVMALVGASFFVAGNRIHRALLRRPVVVPAPAPTPEAPSPLPERLAPPPLADFPSASQLPTASSTPPTSSSTPPALSSSSVDEPWHPHTGSSNCVGSGNSTTSSGSGSSDAPPKSSSSKNNKGEAASNEVSAIDAGAMPPPPASESPLEPSVYAMALHVQRTARGIGARCVTVALLGVLYGLSRPSPTPVYNEQNSLPPLLSGQVPYFLFTVTVMNTSTYIASYLRFWKARRETAIARTLERKRLPQLQQQRLLADQGQLLQNGSGTCSGGGGSNRGGGGGFAGVDPRASVSTGNGSSGDWHTSRESNSYDIQLSTIHEFSEAREMHSSSSPAASSLERIEEGVTRVAPSFVPPIAFSLVIAPSGSSQPHMPRGVQ